ncbi:hypothetical protein BAUCODRAFT_273785 [Baudoinia panamericana UAMH 10762]|uniref:DUF7730 domain-containing protein n=1 Tax=Baudoinia panamericana (strain UAMH 10762) TaxID=717646 RepID=M2MNS1_BAUPA|nr:uncharacterized protein BAUCODRAFT_273785 [Baudoinia panamericana UAMH 10762]EMC93098.1 hypothetical protein BAUCODRAFT_273785 [Baudoinia panamericana UAMH 10762]
MARPQKTEEVVVEESVAVTLPSPAAAPKKRRPTKVLAAKKVSKACEEPYKANATKSPLLRLPPEVRNRIWGILLAGKTLHIEAVKVKGTWKVHHSICCSSTNDVAEAQRISTIHRDVGFRALDSYADRHNKCKLLYRSRIIQRALPLQILASCHQIHWEAALLAYETSTFSLDHIVSLAPFLQALIPAQAYAIKSIVITNGFLYHTPTKTLQKVIKTKLRGLKQFTCFVRYYGGVGGQGSSGRQERIAEEERYMTQLQVCPIQSANVAVFCAYRGSHNFNHKAAGKWTSAMSRRVENAITSTDTIQS